MRCRLRLTIPSLVFIACASTPTEPPSPHVEPTSSTAMATPPPPAPTVASATPPTPTPPPEPPKPAACPADMKLVDGDYCTRVEHRCKLEWYAPQNNKRVCEQFEEGYAKCVGKRVKKRFCMDTYSWPNQKGERPEVMNNFHQAQVKCAAVGKRLCTETEWSFACEGPEMKPFPHGFTRDPRKCNGDHQWDRPSLSKMVARDPTELARLWKGVRSGSQPDCISDFGVADLPANTDEVVMAEFAGAKHSSVQTGGPWYSGVRNQCRTKIYTHGEETFGYFLSFRCCSEADGKENQRLSMKQLRDGVTWKRVEQIAQFDIAKMQEFLKKKESGTCTCGRRDILCNTMCGTTLGPGAVDGSDATRVRHRLRKKIKP